MGNEILSNRVLTGLIRKFEPRTTLVGLNLAPRKPTSKFRAQIGEWDVIKRSRGILDPVTPGSEATTVANLATEHKVAKLSYYRAKKRLKGETMYWVRNPGSGYSSQWGKARVREEAEDLNWQIDRSLEKQVWDMFTGTVNFTLEGVAYTIDQGMDVTHTGASAAVKWNTPATATPLEDIKAAKALIREDGGEEPTDVFISDVYMDWLTDNSKVQALLHNDKGAQVLANGYISRLSGLNWHVFDYGYTDAAGTFVRYMAEDHFIMIAKGNESPDGKVTNDLFDVLEGASTDTKSDGSTGKFMKSWEQEDPSGTFTLADWYAMVALQKPESVVYMDLDP